MRLTASLLPIKKIPPRHNNDLFFTAETKVCRFFVKQVKFRAKDQEGCSIIHILSIAKRFLKTAKYTKNALMLWWGETEWQTGIMEWLYNGNHADDWGLVSPVQGSLIEARLCHSSGECGRVHSSSKKHYSSVTHVNHDYGGWAKRHRILDLKSFNSFYLPKMRKCKNVIID